MSDIVALFVLWGAVGAAVGLVLGASGLNPRTTALWLIVLGPVAIAVCLYKMGLDTGGDHFYWQYRAIAALDATVAAMVGHTLGLWLRGGRADK